jgi:hypothetical protein
MDQDWEVDGATAGSAGGSGDEASRAERRESESFTIGSRPGNVVPFPGSWFGSVEDLVPVHPGPLDSTGELAAAAGESNVASAADASDFWEGDADALEDLSPVPEPQSSLTLLRSDRAGHRGHRSASASTVDTGPGGDRDAPDGAVRRFTERAAWMRVPAVAALLSAAGIALLATTALSGVLGARASRPAAHTTAVSRQPTARVVTRPVPNPTTATAPRRERRHGAAKASTHAGARRRRRQTPETKVATVATNGSPVATGSQAPAVPVGGAPAFESHSASEHEPPGARTPGAQSHTSAAPGLGASGCAPLSPEGRCRP